MRTEVARDYFVLRGLQDQLALTGRNDDNQFNTLKLTRMRLEAGRGNELDTGRAEAQWRTTLSSIPGSFGYLAPTFGDLGQAEARFFSIGPCITWAAFDLGRVRARICSAQAETDAALASGV
jgi:outer membrane protein TolC